MSAVDSDHELALVYPREKTLFGILATVAILLWLLIIVGTIGIALIYVLLGVIAYLFVQSAFISYLKGTGVLVTQAQFPDLHERVRACCRILDVEDPPDTYLIHADGAFNALATRFLGRNFIVLFSNVVDALADDPDAINFYIGHELGHIERAHLPWAPVLWPAKLLPVLGAAYGRACEYTCDAYGAACTTNRSSALNGLGALAAGDERWRNLNINAYKNQADNSGEFWMSFHELTGEYPWLTKRVKRLLEGNDYKPPRRSMLAFLLSWLIPNIGIGGGGSLIITIAMIGVLAAVAIPAYQDYTIRAQVTQGLVLATEAKAAVNEFYAKNGFACESNADCGAAPAQEYSTDSVRHVQIGEGSVITIEYSLEIIDGETILFEPYLDENENLQWSCFGGTLEPKYRTVACRDE